MSARDTRALEDLILYVRREHGLTLEEIGQTIDRTRGDVRQMELRAIQRERGDHNDDDLR